MVRQILQDHQVAIIKLPSHQTIHTCRLQVGHVIWRRIVRLSAKFQNLKNLGVYFIFFGQSTFWCEAKHRVVVGVHHSTLGMKWLCIDVVLTAFANIRCLASDHM